MYRFATNHNALRHRQTDRQTARQTDKQTDGRTDDSIMPIADYTACTMAVQSAKNCIIIIIYYIFIN